MNIPSSKNVGLVLGISTCISFLFIFLFSFIFSNFTHFFQLPELSYWNLFVFSSIIAINDVGSTISFYKSLGIPSTLRLLLESETITSEFFSDLLYRYLIEQQLNLSGSPLLLNYLKTILGVLLGSVCIGLGASCAFILLLKYCIPSVEGIHHGHVLLFLSTGIVSYLLAEGYHFSGILSIRFCGSIIIRFGQYYLSEKKYPFYNLSSIS